MITVALTIDVVLSVAMIALMCAFSYDEARAEKKPVAEAAKKAA